MWNKIMVEVKAGHYAGPFKDKPPFKFYVQSPVGLVPKDKGRKTRLIFHLSYPKTGHSVNSGIPKSKTSVKYPDFTEAIKLCMAAGVTVNCTKSDMSMAFRNIPLSPHTWSLLVIKISYPVSKEVMYFLTNAFHLEVRYPVKYSRIFQTVLHIWYVPVLTSLW